MGSRWKVLLEMFATEPRYSVALGRRRRQVLYTAHHAAKATNATTVHRAKHGIVDIDMG
jgi:hypothetical protein